MKLSDLLEEVERSEGNVTVVDLAERVGSTPTFVRAALDALLASGQLKGGASGGTDPCPSAGSCGVVCHGRVGCPLVTDPGGTLRSARRLTVGSELTSEDAGERELKGVPERWRLHQVAR